FFFFFFLKKKKKKGLLDEDKDAEHRGLNKDIDHHLAHIEKSAHPELEADWDSTSDHFQHTDFNAVLEYHDFTVVNFYANWCIHCRHFAPTWKEAEEETDRMEFRDKNREVVVAKLLRVNCVDFGDLCARIGIRAYPTVRLYKHDKSFTQYTGPREKQSIINFVKDFIHNEDTGKHEVVAHHRLLQEGCRVHGELLVRRVPGYFFLEAESKLDSLDPFMTNVSHRVNHLHIVGDRAAMQDYAKRTASQVTRDIFKNTEPMKSTSFITFKPHTAPQHYLNVIPTRFDDKYVFSPLSIKVSTKGRPLYDFLTSVFAIIVTKICSLFWFLFERKTKIKIQNIKFKKKKTTQIVIKTEVNTSFFQFLQTDKVMLIINCSCFIANQTHKPILQEIEKGRFPFESQPTTGKNNNMSFWRFFVFGSSEDTGPPTSDSSIEDLAREDAVKIVKTTWAELMRKKEEVGLRIYQEVLLKEVEMSRLFLQTKIDKQSNTFMMMLNTVVGYLDDLSTLDEKLTALGVTHLNKYGVKRRHFKHFRTAFMRAIKQYVPWTDRREAAWMWFWARIIDRMTADNSLIPFAKDTTPQQYMEYAKAIHETFDAVIADDPQHFSNTFYQDLLDSQPDIATLFKHTEIQQQGAKFISM
ncbi:hypothetical protein RFI_15655, partial [Reticulomyxa filosa]